MLWKQCHTPAIWIDYWLIDWLIGWLVDWLIVTTDSVGQFGDPPGSPTQLGGCGLPRAIHQPGWGGDHFTTLRTPIVGNSLKPGSNSSQTSGLHVFPYSELGFHRLFQMCNSNSGFRILTLDPNMSAWPHPAATLLWISTPAAIQQGSWRWVHHKHGNCQAPHMVNNPKRTWNQHFVGKYWEQCGIYIIYNI